MKPLLDPEVLWIAFLVAATAELGCLARTAALVLRLDQPFSVCIGTLLGNVAVLLPIFVLGSSISRYLPAEPVRITTSLLFILMGCWMLFYGGHRH